MVLLFQPLKVGFLWLKGTSVETWVSTLLGQFLSALCLLLLDKIKIPNQKLNDFWKLEIKKLIYFAINLTLYGYWLQLLNFIVLVFWLCVSTILWIFYLNYSLVQNGIYIQVLYRIGVMCAELFVLSNYLTVVRPWSFSYIVSYLVIYLVLYLARKINIRFRSFLASREVWEDCVVNKVCSWESDGASCVVQLQFGRTSAEICVFEIV